MGEERLRPSRSLIQMQQWGSSGLWKVPPVLQLNQGTLPPTDGVTNTLRLPRSLDRCFPKRLTAHASHLTRHCSCRWVFMGFSRPLPPFLLLCLQHSNVSSFCLMVTMTANVKHDTPGILMSVLRTSSRFFFTVLLRGSCYCQVYLQDEQTGSGELMCPQLYS